MTDEADLATDREERDRADALSRRRPEAPPSCGACLNCGESLAGGRRWCDAACRDDWERMARRPGRIAPGATIDEADAPT